MQNGSDHSRGRGTPNTAGVVQESVRWGYQMRRAQELDEEERQARKTYQEALYVQYYSLLLLFLQHICAVQSSRILAIESASLVLLMYSK
jgi:hypothetical protein